MQNTVLFRPELSVEDEQLICAEVFRGRYFEYRSQIPENSLVIGRYSVLPFYEELEKELALKGSQLLNSYQQHCWIASMAWAVPGGALEGLTPAVYARWGDLPEGKYVVKGRTNSRKQQWDKKMFAPNKASIPEIARALYDDPLIGSQGVIVRPYIPLKQFAVGIGGIPITNEWRTFWYVDNQGVYLLGTGFYWSSFPECMDQAELTDKGMRVAEDGARRIQKAGASRFFVLDVAETTNGDWIIIEVNDGQSSGLANVSAQVLYTNLDNALRNRLPVGD